ncbi:DinB family protein [Alteribacter populi]|uniref:DinB family protein n=1 Tax=Alteribacter populi TaxID=2011011 RepID=UPI000BBAEB5A|nr:DinB family protein [Alteribacter populi]
MNGTLKAFQLWRERAILTISATSEELADHVPDGFKNNIRWNAGHILANLNHKLEPLSDEKEELDSGFRELFLNGTSPADWEGRDVPLLETIILLLKEQQEWVLRNEKSILNARLTKSFRGMETGEELIQLLIGHDSMHIGVINSIKYASRIDDVWGKTK